jgi:hypothetical protein
MPLLKLKTGERTRCRPASRIVSIEPVPPTKREPARLKNLDRDLAIMAAREARESFRSIGNRHGLTRQAVFLICKRIGAKLKKGRHDPQA